VGAALPGRTRRGAARGRGRIEENLEMLAVAESYDNGKPVRETIATEGGYKASYVGRENHRMMLEHYTQTKCLLVSYDPNPLGFF
jgi:acyl-CoA reductase-like NAD-dependent aldehyde dehydrogenase